MKTKQLNSATKRVQVSMGESVRIIRVLQGLSIVELARATGIPQSTISAIEGDLLDLDKKCASVLAKALKCKPEAFSG